MVQCPAAPPAYRLETAQIQHVEGVLTGEVHTPNHVAKEWVVYGPRLTDLPGQTRASSSLEPGGREASEAGELRRPLWVARVPANTPRLGKSITIRIRIQADLASRHLVELKPGEKPPHVPALADREKQLALLSHGQIDLKDARFQKWLDAHELRRGKTESDLEFARRAFLFIKRHFKYEYKEEMDRHTGYVCGHGRSDCGGLSALFVATMRASHVPARLRVGRWTESDKKGDRLEGIEYHQTHVKAEFFAEGVGWVPVDMAGAVSQEGGDRFANFGHDEGDFITFHLDSDFQVDTILFGTQTAEWLQGARWWVTGDGKLEPTKTTEDWQVRSKKK